MNSGRSYLYWCCIFSAQRVYLDMQISLNGVSRSNAIKLFVNSCQLGKYLMCDGVLTQQTHMCETKAKAKATDSGLVLKLTI